MDPEITILIPIYNGIEYLGGCTKSVTDQTYTNWYILIGINGHSSQSDVFQQAKRYENEKIKVKEYQTKNKAETLMQMKKDVTSDYIALLDVDDLWHPKKLEEQIKYLNYDIIGTLCNYFGEKNILIPIPQGDLSNYNFFMGNPIINSSVLMKRELLLFDDEEVETPNGLFPEDYDLWLKLRKMDKKFFNVPQVLTFLRIHKNSFTYGKTHDLSRVLYKYI